MLRSNRTYYFGLAVIFLVCVSGIICSPSKSRGMNKTIGGNHTSIGTTEASEVDTTIVNQVKPYKVIRNREKKPENGISMQSIVSAIIASPEAMSQMDKIKNKLINYFETKGNGTLGGELVEMARGHGGGHHGVGHGGIGFPSLEGALLSLAFLTFAVFLIDLIQQMIGGYRTGSANPLFGRRKREVMEDLDGNLDRNHHLSTLTSEVLTSLESPLYYH